MLVASLNCQGNLSPPLESPGSPFVDSFCDGAAGGEAAMHTISSRPISVAGLPSKANHRWVRAPGEVKSREETWY